MSLQCIFNRFSVYVDVVSNENVALFWIQSLSVCRAITFLITELIMFSPAQRPLGSVSIIEPEAPGVLLRLKHLSTVGERVEKRQDATENAKRAVRPPQASPARAQEPSALTT